VNPVLKLGLEVLATSRITRLVVDDHITGPVREKIWQADPPENMRVGFMVTCHSCTSVWAAALVRSGILPPVLRDTLALSELVLWAKKVLDI
jgi:hypothetical protein